MKTLLRLLQLSALVALSACASPIGHESADPAQQDSVAAVRIKAALIEKLEMAATAIDVQFEEGRATLGGFVETAAEREQAAAIALQQPFVDHVENQIVVRGPAGP